MSARTSRPRGPISALFGMLLAAVLAGVMITVGVAPAIAFTGVGAKNGIGLFETLPDDLQIASLQQKTEIYATRSGRPVQIASFYNQNREVVPWTDIPASVKNAAVAAEDTRFYQHGGVDPMGIVRAIVSNASGASQQGASTITQQYVKNVCIQEAELLPTAAKVQAAYDECTGGIGRKLKEARLAIGLEKKYSKDQILLGYLNITGFGGRIYGIESAAQYYFHTHAKDLTDAQAASLLAIVNAPEVLRIDEKADIPANTDRRNYILSSELKHGMLSQAAYDKAVATPVRPHITPTTTGCAQAGAAAYFCDYVVQTILQNPQFGKSAGERYNNLQGAGWKIYTTLDLDLERQAKSTISTYVPARSPAGTDLAGAAVTVQVGTGHILSMVQSKTFDDSASAATRGAGYTATSLNYNTDETYGGSHGFQPGSTYKLFTLLDWLKQGKGVYQSVDGTQRKIPFTSFKACGKQLGVGTFDVGNDEGAAENGQMSVYSATARSVNGAYASMAEQLDLCNIRQTAMDLGVHRADGNELLDNPASILGTNTVAPLSMATAYAGIANQGQVCKPVAITRIVKTDGSQLPIPASDCSSGVPRSIAIAAGYALHGVFGGTARGDDASLNGAFGMVKTGTTDNAEQTWEVGGTTKTTTAVWVGNVAGSTNLRAVYSFPGCGAQAALARHCIWRDIVGADQARYPGDAAWPTPDPQYLYGQQVTVPKVVGLSQKAAATALARVGLTAKLGDPVPSATVQKDDVAQSDPAEGSTVTPGTTVTIRPSSGAQQQTPTPAPGTGQQVQVPDVTKQPLATALATLQAAGFSKITEQITPMNTPNLCYVLGQNPPGNTGATTDSEISLQVVGDPNTCKAQ